MKRDAFNERGLGKVDLAVAAHSTANEAARASTSPVLEPLFRQEALNARNPRLLGDIVLTPRISMTAVSIVAAAMGLAVIALLIFGSYTRRATVAGQLEPSAGVIRVNTPQSGVIVEKRVRDGQLVEKGDILYVLSSDRVGLASRDIQMDISLQIAERKRSLEAEIERNRGVESQELNHLARRLETHRSEVQSVRLLAEQQQKRVTLAEEALKRYQGLAEKDYIAREQWVQKDVEHSEQQSRLQALQRDALIAQREIAATQREIDSTRMRYANLNSQLARNIASVRQELTETEARRRVVITAPERGRATLVTAEVGQSIEPSRALLNLLPEDARLEAHLYAPSRTIGFVRTGDRVLVRYQAFPYQKFGQHEGRVVGVSNAAVPSTELAAFALPEVGPGEPVYAIRVELSSQSLKAYGNDQPLQPGMRLEGDILQETRKLYEWMLEPLYSVTGKMER